MKTAPQTSQTASPGRHVARKFLPLALAVIALSGCKHFEDGSQVAGWTLVDPSQRHPIMVTQQPAHLNLAVVRGSQGLTPAQRAEVVEFASRYRAGDAGNSRLVISAPSGGANEVAAMEAVGDIRALLVDGGFSETAIAVEAYHDDSTRTPPVHISYMRFVAEGPACGSDWSENLAYSPRNFNYPDFGCATQHNLAAMVANPADLLGPRTEGPRYSDRRDTVMNTWVKGESTASKKSDDERVKVKISE